AAGLAPQFTNASTTAVTYYLFHFRSRLPEDKGRSSQAGTPFLLDWKDMEMKKTDKGESRPIFSRPVAWLGKIDLHATTLNPGEVSHAPHIHRAEEIILLRSGHVKEYIAGQYHKASAGDLIFLPSGVPHAVENKSNQRCEYFALQWLP
ncbi:MAG: cupin domain-containing protein, partial [Bacteroidota bacterium]